MEALAPPSFICPITQQVMVRPVCTSYGHSYEEDALLGWLRTSQVDPMTTRPLDELAVSPNRSLQDAIRAHFESLVSAKAEPLPDSVREDIASFIKHLGSDESARWKSGGEAAVQTRSRVSENSWRFHLAEVLAGEAHAYGMLALGGLSGVLSALLCSGETGRALLRECVELLQGKGRRKLSAPGAFGGERLDRAAVRAASVCACAPLVGVASFLLLAVSASVASVLSIVALPPRQAVRRAALEGVMSNFLVTHLVTLIGCAAQDPAVLWRHGLFLALGAAARRWLRPGDP